MTSQLESSGSPMMMPNGAGAAAVLAAGIASFAMGVLSVLEDKFTELARLLIIYRPTGPLSGLSTVVIVVWIGTWLLLSYRWKGRNVHLGRTVTIALILLAVGVLLTFPPIGDLF
jgi:hypothetical protein